MHMLYIKHSIHNFTVGSTHTKPARLCYDVYILLMRSLFLKLIEDDAFGHNFVYYLCSSMWPYLRAVAVV
jgi:hypothetical protein